MKPGTPKMSNKHKNKPSIIVFLRPGISRLKIQMICVTDKPQNGVHYTVQ